MIAQLKRPARKRVTVRLASKQRGVTLIVGLIMLLLITLTVAGAFTVSSSNLKSVGNFQVREEAIAASNLAIEQVMSSPFTTSLVSQEINVDINKDGTTDYVIVVDIPVCTRALVATTGGATEIGFGGGGGGTWNTEWDISATATDAASGTSVRIREGIRIRLTDAQKSIACP